MQYCAALSSDKMAKAARDFQHSRDPARKAPRSAFNFRVCDEPLSDKLSGYGHNGVTPVFCAAPMPVFLAEAVVKLGHGWLWLGGGDTDIKLRIAIDELIAKAEAPVVVADISNPRNNLL